jgi:hypothetical protein
MRRFVRSGLFTLFALIGVLSLSAPAFAGWGRCCCCSSCCSSCSGCYSCYGCYGCGSCCYSYPSSCGYCCPSSCGYSCPSSCGYGCPSSCNNNYGACNQASCGNYDCGAVVPVSLAVRQVKGAYFNVCFSTWVEVDVMVPAWQAMVGVSAYARVPAVGDVRVWITEVYAVPKVNAPKFANPS